MTYLFTQFHTSKRDNIVSFSAADTYAGGAIRSCIHAKYGVIYCPRVNVARSNKFSEIVTKTENRSWDSDTITYIAFVILHAATWYMICSWGSTGTSSLHRRLPIFTTCISKGSFGAALFRDSAQAVVLISTHSFIQLSAHIKCSTLSTSTIHMASGEAATQCSCFMPIKPTW